MLIVAHPDPHLCQYITVTYEDDDCLVDELVGLVAAAVHAVRLVRQHPSLEKEPTRAANNNQSTTFQSIKQNQFVMFYAKF